MSFINALSLLADLSPLVQPSTRRSHRLIKEETPPDFKDTPVNGKRLPRGNKLAVPRKRSRHAGSVVKQEDGESSYLSELSSLSEEESPDDPRSAIH